MGAIHGREATLDEVLEAIEALDERAFVILHQRAVRFVFGTRYRDPQDLVSDALESAIAGAREPGRIGRHWPIGVPFLAFLTQAMRGIASNDRESKATRAEVLATDLIGVEDGDSDEALDAVNQTHSPGVDVQLIAAADAAELIRQRDALFDWFKDDDEVSLILMALEDGLRGAAIQAECGITKTEYETARKRLNRGVAKMVAQRSVQ